MRDLAFRLEIHFGRSFSVESRRATLEVAFRMSNNDCCPTIEWTMLLYAYSMMRRPLSCLVCWPLNVCHQFYDQVVNAVS